MIQPAVKLRAAAKLLKTEFFHPPLKQHIAVAELLESIARQSAELDWVASETLEYAVKVADKVVEVYLEGYAPETEEIPNKERVDIFYNQRH